MLAGNGDDEWLFDRLERTGSMRSMAKNKTKMEGEMKLYKLTDDLGRTKNKTQWGENVTVCAESHGPPELCSRTVIHAYRNLNLAMLLNPIHGEFYDPQIWEAEGEIAVEDWGKVGCKSLTTIKRLEYSSWYADPSKRKDVQVWFAILCAESVLIHFESKFPNDDRPRKAIEAAKEYLRLKTARAARAAASAADRAASAADYAAYSAADAAQIDFSALALQAIELAEKGDDENE